MEAIWTLDWRVYPAAAITLVGLVLGVRGGILMIGGFAQPMDRAGKNLVTMRGMRMMLQGISVAAIGVGWWLHWPVMVAAGAIVGFEETIETSIACWALKQEYEEVVHANHSIPRSAQRDLEIQRPGTAATPTVPRSALRSRARSGR